MKHTFLFEQGAWRASGKFTDEAEKEYDIEGRSDVSHEGGVWLNRSWMRLRTEPPFSIENVYEIEPFKEGAMMTTWTSHNPAFGELSGTFELEGNTITSRYASEDQKVRGFETVTMIDEETYRGRGEIYIEGKLTSSWNVTLERLLV
jgi:hypothetical protein